MGRRKKRRSRGRGGQALGTGVEAVDFEFGAPHPHPLAEVSAALAAGEGASGPAATAPGHDPSHNVQTLGELLQQARESRGLSIEEASARTRIASTMLRHLESDRFGEFAADTYVKGFLRNYGSFLGVDVGMLLRRYEAISGRHVEREPEVLQVETAHGRPRRSHSERRGWIVAAVAVAVAALGWVFWSRGAAQLGLRPTPGLEQIENELRGTALPALVQPAPAPPAAVPTDSTSTGQLAPDAVAAPGVTTAPPPAAADAQPAAESAKPKAGSAKPTAGGAKPAARRPSPHDTNVIEDLVPPGPQ